MDNELEEIFNTAQAIKKLDEAWSVEMRESIIHERLKQNLHTYDRVIQKYQQEYQDLTSFKEKKLYYNQTLVHMIGAHKAAVEKTQRTLKNGFTPREHKHFIDKFNYQAALNDYQNFFFLKTDLEETYENK